MATEDRIRLVIVLNHSYFPETFHRLARVGATAFAMSAVQVLRQVELFRGEDLQQPMITIEVSNSVLCVTISFNFNMKEGLLGEAIGKTSELLACNDNILPMLYYQTDTLLRYHPNYLPPCVTHYTPFYKDFTCHFLDELAGIAFGSQQKAQHLHQLKARDNAFVFQHPRVQGRYFNKSGIDKVKIFQHCPPIYSMSITYYPEMIHTSLRDAVNTVARLDYFKDIDLLVDTTLHLHQQSLPVTVLIDRDDEKDTGQRTKLYERIPISYRKSFYIAPKPGKDVLYSLFEHCRHEGIFVCPSRYETLGITPLESGLCGVTTLISNSKQAEVRRFPPKRYCLLRTSKNLATTIKGFENANLYECGRELQKHLEKNISEKRFKSHLLHAGRECSQWSERSFSLLLTRA
ncbi:hypothetical protein GQ44DRAFT_737103 [Phaeosphaeriaceae sp. PMI808]|nr:hypothetical protein GQ44DRAFT_737103 [Phaeosphaeriaceae sp. PMI808]